jgi:alkanesulfonate monooxygenase SsuD/methylene tetrahydromethanopterin reductase-like flavin-dependent oxidoreductase (luciferase family)
MTTAQLDKRAATNPLFNDNQMKIGIIAMNCSHGSTITTAENAWRMDWPKTREVATMADAAGFEVLLPVARWRGYGGPTNFNNRTFDCFTWASAVGAVTNHACIFSTVHVPLIHPLAAAKQAATVDHVTGGRFGLNVVCGWFKNEFEMFGAEWREHEVRYQYATEWLDFVRKLWSHEGELDYDGRWFKATKAWSEPKPVQKPFPPVMNAGGSAEGQKFAATQAEMNFVILREHDLEGGKRQIDALKNMARANGRDCQVWIHVYAVCRDTEREAKDYLDYYVRKKGDYVAVDNLLKIFEIQSKTLDPKVLDQFRFHFIAGHGGYPLVGTASQIVDEISKLTRMGVDGMLISWVDYKAECRQWIDEVLPLMEQAGQRRPHRMRA